MSFQPRNSFMPFEIVASSTRKDAHGHTLSIETLKRTEELVNESKFASPYLFQHDRSLPALGKVVSASLHLAEDGHTELRNVIAEFDQRSITEFKGRKLYREICSDDARPLTAVGQDAVEADMRIYLDPEDYQNSTDFEHCANQIALKSQLKIELVPATRKGLGLEALIILVFAKLGEKIFERQLDKASDKIGQQIDKLGEASRTAVSEVSTRKKPELGIKEISVFEYDDVFVELHYEGENPAELAPLYTHEALAAVFQEVQDAKELFGCKRVRYKLRAGKWDLLSIDTPDGQQLYSQQTMDEYVAKQIEQADFCSEHGLTPGFSINITVPENERLG